jgi:molecular chaperone GrpE
MKKNKYKKMNKQFEPETTEQKTNFADNFADNAPNEQTDEVTNNAEQPQETDEQPENPADELARTKDAYLRLMAEYDNYRKRTIKEKADLIKNGGEKTLNALLPVVDDFERAMQTIEKASDIDAIKEGLSLIFNKFQTYLGQNGVKKIETAEQNFDADLHEAVAMIPATDESQKGKIIDTVQTGYMLNDKVLRHAKVVVAN